MIDSPAFPPGSAIPTEYTCEGKDTSPPLAWSGVPSGTASLVLVVEDTDAPGGVFRHWAVFDIPADATGLRPGYGSKRPGEGFREAKNDLGTAGYSGPCPPKGRGAHHYHFRLFALRQPNLNLDPAASAAAVLKAAQPYIIAQTEVVGTYRR
jgi:Raf kinase inhibitor-like YbhB/YbcL family protein